MLIDSFVVFFLLHGPFEASFYEITVLPEDIKRMEWNGMVWSSLPVIIYAFIARKTAETMFQHYLSPGGVKDFFFGWGGGERGNTWFSGGNGLKPLLNRRINKNPHRALKEKVIAQ